MSDDLAALRIGVAELQARDAALTTLLTELLAITHHDAPENLRSRLTLQSKVLQAAQDDPSTPPQRLAAHRVVLSLLDQALTTLEDDL